MLLALLGCSDYAIDGAEKPPDALPILQVDPGSLDFGTVPPDCVMEDVLTLTNIGDGTLTISEVVPEGEGFSSETLAMDLAPGASTPLRVRFDPTAEGAYRGTIEIHSNDTANPEYPVPVEGLASYTIGTSDTFIQGSTSIDVLWVMDNSSSMAQEQARVADSITSFFGQFEALGADYHMGVITTDVTNPLYSGNLVGDPTYIDPATPDAQALLSLALNVGENDMGNESGLAATELALTEPVLSGTNLGFYRPEAKLAVVFLSDEPEQSEPDAQHYIDFFTALKPDPTDLVISSIVGDYGTGCATTCDGVAEDAQPGDKYIDVSTAMAGVVESLCTCDISSALTNIGENAVALVASFDLTHEPVDDTISVFVDDSSSGDWRYDDDDNTIVFSDPPEEGETVTVTYLIALECPSDPAPSDTGDTGDSGIVDTAGVDTGA